MNIEDSIKHKACNVDYFAARTLEYAQELEKYSTALLQEVRCYQGQMAILKEMNEQLVKALECIRDGALFTKPIGTIFKDEEDEQTLHDFVKTTLENWG